MPSPLVVDGLVYLSGESGISPASTRRPARDYTHAFRQFRHRASPVYADGKVYCLPPATGPCYVVKAGPKFELLATNQIEDDQTASPVVADGRIYLRGFKNLYAIGTK